MNALWKVGEFRSGDKIELCLATADKIEAYEKHHSFVRWVYEHHEAPEDANEIAHTLCDIGQEVSQRLGDDALADRLCAAVGKLAAVLRKPDAFKAYVHQRLDAMGVPPESEHGVGGRLDWVEANIKRYLWLRSCTVGPSMVERTLYQTVNDDCNPPYRDLMHGADLDRAIDGQLP